MRKDDEFGMEWYLVMVLGTRLSVEKCVGFLGSSRYLQPGRSTQRNGVR